MAISTLHSLFAVELVKDASVWLGGIQSDSMSLESQTAGEPASGSLWPQIQSLTGQSPTRAWSTVALADHLNNLNGINATIGHKLIGADPGLRLWQYKHDQGGSRAGFSDNHRSILITQGLVVPGGISVAHQGDAVLTYAAIATSANGASPVTELEGESLQDPFPVLDNDRWTLGPVIIDGVLFDHVRGLEISFGVSAVAEGSDSDIWPTFASIRTVNPVITLRGIDVSWFLSTRIPAAGKDVEAGNSRIYLRKRDQGGTYVAPGLTSHIKFTFNGIAVMQVVHDANNNDPTELTLEISIQGGQGQDVPPLIVDTASGIML